MTQQLTYKQIDILFNDNKLEEVLNYCNREAFGRINYYVDLLINSALNEPEEIKKALQEMTGLKMLVNRVLSAAITAKKNSELRSYMFKKNDKEGKLAPGERFVSAPIDKEASLDVAQIRRVRNVVDGYVKDCLTAITTCQSLLGYEKEYLKQLSSNKG